MNFDARSVLRADAVGDILVGEFLQKPLRDLEDRFDLLIGEVVDRNDVARRRLGFVIKAVL